VLWLIFIVLINPAVRPAALDLSYTAFKRHVVQGVVAAVTIQGEQVTGEFRKALSSEGEPEGKTYKHFRTVAPPFAEHELGPLLEDHGVTVRAKEVSVPWFRTLLITLLPWALILGLFIYGQRRMQQGLGGWGGGFLALVSQKQSGTTKRAVRCALQMSLD
jgi:cell division protease FtsH